MPGPPYLTVVARNGRRSAGVHQLPTDQQEYDVKAMLDERARWTRSGVRSFDEHSHHGGMEKAGGRHAVVAAAAVSLSREQKTWGGESQMS